jgi:hypothetical protein
LFVPSIPGLSRVALRVNIAPKSRRPTSFCPDQ